MNSQSKRKCVTSMTLHKQIFSTASDALGVVPFSDIYSISNSIDPEIALRVAV